MEIEFKRNGNYGYITPPAANSYVRELFKVRNPNPKATVYNKFLYPMSPNGRFDIGLFPLIKDRIKNDDKGHTISILQNDFLHYVVPKLGDYDIESIEGFTYYGYQEDAIINMIKFGRGIINLPTGAGKGLVMAGFSKTMLENIPDYKIIILVPNISLLKQLYGEFVNDYGLDSVTRWSGGFQPDFDKNIIITNSQIILSNLDSAISMLGDYDCLIVDECHKIKKKNNINSFIDRIQTPNRFGLTGTIPKEELDAWNVFGKLGPIIISRKSYELREDIGSISDVIIKIIKLHHDKRPKKYKPLPDEAFKPTGQYENETDFIYNNEWRNGVIVDIGNRLNGNVLILVDRLNHGNLLYELFKDSKKEIFFIHGETHVDERYRIQKLMEERSDVICVAMCEIFSTGISIKNLKYAVFSCIGKSYTRVLQAIGRTLRKHENKEKAVIFDITDNTKYSSDHFAERLKFYKEEKINYEFKEIRKKQE